MFLIFDTETTGLPKNYNAPISDSNNWPRVVQLAWQLHHFDGSLESAGNLIITPDGFEIPIGVSNIHGITTQRAIKQGVPLEDALNPFLEALNKAEYLIGHNVTFDINIVGAEFFRKNLPNPIEEKKTIDTQKTSTNFCAIPGRGKSFKWPKLEELYQKLFNQPFINAHDAAFDVNATAKCFFKLITLKVVSVNEISNTKAVKYIPPKIAQTNFEGPSPTKAPEKITHQQLNTENHFSSDFIHLHNHSEFSVLESSSKINDIINRAIELNMSTIALTDNANLMGAFNFIKAAKKGNIKPIIGCEFNLCEDHTNKKVKDNGHKIIALAKNKEGYSNLVKLTSLSNIDGFYYVPRIDKDLLLKYKENLIILSGDYWGDLSQKILFEGETKANECLLWWKEHFKDDFYIELNRLDFEGEKEVNEILIALAKKNKIPLVACNSNFYSETSNAHSQDILTCIKNGNLMRDTKKYNEKITRESRFGLPNSNFYIKSKEEMCQLFNDIPEAVKNTLAIAEKVSTYSLERKVALPEFKFPESFQNENDYLNHLSYEGAKEKYKEGFNDEVKKRLDFELSVIKKTGYPGYFLIVQDLCKYAKSVGVSVGPGRGSAAGSVVAYCTGITNIDPLKYNLLFERFLNPDRISMPDIDIDFDDVGRKKMIAYVIEKYGSNQVAQIITYGTMAAKSSIRDTARVLDLSLEEAGRLSEMVGSTGLTLKKLKESTEKDLKRTLKGASYINALEIKSLLSKTGIKSSTVKEAKKIEGLIRNTGTHACGIIITPSNITDFAPVSLVKDSKMVCTQFDNNVVEDAGLLKMDFLGLSTLSVINETLRIIKERQGEPINIDQISLEDKPTFKLFQKGQTKGIFQYESTGMQQAMKQLKPSEFSDLIVLNALYRPGPMEYLPTYIKRKHKEEEISYDFPEMEEHLKETYGITVYQEQVMLLSQKLGNFSKGEADVLRKAMGKKKRDVLNQMKPKFIKNATEKGLDKAKLEKVWKDWESFAEYAFNKSHAVCYALIGYQTAYLKANYPAEFMAAILSNNLNEMSKLSFFIEECQNLKIPILGPDINESNIKFSVNDRGAIRFGLAAIKGVGISVSQNIINQRAENGIFSSFEDFTIRLDKKSLNKKTIESLVNSGAFDIFQTHRAAYHKVTTDYPKSYIEQMIAHGNNIKAKKDAPQISLFDQFEEEVSLTSIAPPECEEWSAMEKLIKEKELIGIFISSHPLNDYKIEVDYLCTPGNIKNMLQLDKFLNKSLCLAGVISNPNHLISKKGNPWGRFTLEDFFNSFTFSLFGETYKTYEGLIKSNELIFIKGVVKERLNKLSNNKEASFFINTVSPITTLLEKETKSIILKVNADRLSSEDVDTLFNTISNNKGNIPLRVIIESSSKKSATLESKKFRFKVTSPAIEKINLLDAVKVGLLNT